MRFLCTFSIVDQPQTGASGVACQGRRHGPSITYKITPCWIPFLQPARRAAVLGQSSGLRPHWSRQNSVPTFLLPHWLILFSLLTCLSRLPEQFSESQAFRISKRFHGGKQKIYFLVCSYSLGYMNPNREIKSSAEVTKRVDLLMFKNK